MSSNPTLINLPPPPSDPQTPSEVPSRSGTPNSTTTSMSELSTVAIKDGHRGLGPHHHHQTSGLSNQLDAERADRISRLAGLERVTTARNPLTPTNPYPGGPAGSFPTSYTSGGGAGVNASAHPPPVSYFDASGNPALARERSTVGSASATGSVGAGTTWAGDSEAGDTSNFDKMSESQGDMDLDRESFGAGGEDTMSEDGDGGGPGSLVGFGEGARTPARVSGGYSGIGSPPASRGGTPRGVAGDVHMGEDADGPSLGGGVSAPAPGTAAERIVRENMNTTSQDRMTSHNETSPRRGGGGGDGGGL